MAYEIRDQNSKATPPRIPKLRRGNVKCQRSTTCYVDVALLKRHPHEHAAKTLMIDDVDGAHFLCMANLRQPRLALIARRRFLLLKLSDPRNYRSETTILLWKHKSTAIRLVQRGQSISNH